MWRTLHLFHKEGLESEPGDGKILFLLIRICKAKLECLRYVNVDGVNKMIKEHGDLFSDSQCKVCSAVLISESQKLTHYQSKKHANKVRRYLCIQNDMEPTFKKFKSPSSDTVNRSKVCHVCNMTFSSAVVAESHYQGKVHAKNLRLKTIGPQTQSKRFYGHIFVAIPVFPLHQQRPKRDNPDRFCSICQASFNNPLMAQQHYVGKKHKKQMTKLKLMETYGPSTTPASTVKGYPCTLCNIELNSVEQYQAHISGAKHKNQYVPVLPFFIIQLLVLDVTTLTEISRK
uniref:Zinc finger protein 346 n=1 Tax=Myripristis murdjan TaxID=586833 RepID=A0A667Z6P6_9TELE